MHIRLPLDPFNESQSRELIAALEAVGFRMDGLEKADG